jgi:hypothetical protein
MQSSTHESNEEYSSEGNTGIDLSGAIECKGAQGLEKE